MPSPFPGMDPYLEGHLWSGFHSDLISATKAFLNPILGPKYVAMTEKYFLFDSGDEVEIARTRVAPDVGVAKIPGRTMPSGGSAVLESHLVLDAILPEEVLHAQLQIKDTGNMDVVAVLEFLSPVNKRGQGRQEYLEKRTKLLSSTSHLIEIDLLRRGKRVPAANTLPPASYYVFLSRAQHRSKVEVWPRQLDQRCPSIPVPLANGDTDVLLDLQAVLTQAYQVGSFDRFVDYSDEPDVPFSEEERERARETRASHRAHAGKSTGPSSKKGKKLP
ncbi:MAG: DUF4058 family protein [Gemmataceae bacterium]|nr:DUF4058 family protein [Gemmataceae bacterium]